MGATALVIVGAGGHALSVTNVALSCGFDVVAYVDDTQTGTELMGIPVIDQRQCLRLYSQHSLFIAIGITRYENVLVLNINTAFRMLSFLL